MEMRRRNCLIIRRDANLLVLGVVRVNLHGHFVYVVEGILYVRTVVRKNNSARRTCLWKGFEIMRVGGRRSRRSSPRRRRAGGRWRLHISGDWIIGEGGGDEGIENSPQRELVNAPAASPMAIPLG